MKKYDDPDKPVDPEEQETPVEQKRRRLKLVIEVVNLSVLIVLLTLFLMYSVKKESGFVYDLIKDTPIEAACRRLIPYIWHQSGALSEKMLDAPLLPSEERELMPILERMARIRPTHVVILKSGEAIFGQLMATEEEGTDGTTDLLRIREFDGTTFVTRTIDQADIVMRSPVVMPDVKLTPRDHRFLLEHASLNPFLAPPYLVVSHSGYHNVHWLHLTLSKLDEEFRATFAPIIDYVQESPLRHVCVLANQSDYVEHATMRREHGLVNSVGFFSKTKNRLTLFDHGATLTGDTKTDQDARHHVAIIRHEGAHQLAAMYGILPLRSDIPLWLEEGLAQYCEISPLGSRSPDRLQLLSEALEAGELVPIEQVVAIQADDFEELDDAEQKLVYAQSWLLFHTLMTDANRPRFFNYLLTHQVAEQEHPLGDPVQQLMNKLETTPSKLSEEVLIQIIAPPAENP